MTSLVRERLLSESFDKPVFRPKKEEYEEIMTELYGKVAEGCIALQEKVGNYAADRSSIYKEKEKEIKAALIEVPSAREIEEMLAPLGLDIKEFYSLYGKKKIEDAISYSKDLKDRYTVLWLAYDLGVRIKI